MLHVREYVFLSELCVNQRVEEDSKQLRAYWKQIQRQLRGPDFYYSLDKGPNIKILSLLELPGFIAIRKPDTWRSTLRRKYSSVAEQTSTSTHKMGCHHSSGWSPLNEYGYHKRIDFVQWYLHECVCHLGFSLTILYTDETTFHFDKNPHSTQTSDHEVRFAVNGPPLLTTKSDCHFLSRLSLSNTTSLLEEFPLNMWLQRDGDPIIFARHLWQHLTKLSLLAGLATEILCCGMQDHWT
ncbi:hypothetical protein PR048_013109 [Dryococelus australis]|uniref:Maturase K n=1 Tax=Dryococelus australis TaxID=614101 RepID=A0ABQ9HRP6_9NEOP|nr:hypothetical protein PR048_013109 [Dryococelus australis]